jgi:hypothetical protein
VREPAVAERIAAVTVVVKIPVDDYDETVTELLSEVETAVQRTGLEYTQPFISRIRMPQ